MNLRSRICYLLSLLRIHNPDCEHCKAHETCWGDMQKRLEELSWRTQPPPIENGTHGKLVEVRNSKPPKS